MQTSTAATISDLTPVAQALLVIADAMMSDGRVNVLDASERETLEAALTRTMQGEIYGTGLADLLGTIVVRLAKPYRKPRVVAEGEDLYRVSFNDAVTWTVAYAVNSYGDLEWTATGSYSDLTFAWLPSPTPSFRASSADEAFGTIAGYYLNAPVWGELADVHALAEKCEHDRTLYTKTIKRIAKQRFNVKLSARGSRGTGYSWVYIDVARDDLFHEVPSAMLEVFHLRETHGELKGMTARTQRALWHARFGIDTEVMGASFRNVGQITALAGCDLLTISPELLQKLADTEGPVERKLSPEQAAGVALDKTSLDEKSFRMALNEDAMATEKLAEGIRAFIADTEKLEALMKAA